MSKGITGLAVAGATVPIATVLTTARDVTNLPLEYLFCDGSYVSTTVFSDLYEAINGLYTEKYVDGTVYPIGAIRAAIAYPHDVYVTTSAGTSSGADVTSDVGCVWVPSVEFQIPDYRGTFLRAYDDSAGRNPDGNVEVGSYHIDDNKSHNHSYSYPRARGAYFIGGSETYQGYSVHDAAGTTTGASGSEGRPKNTIVNYIIKY